MKIFLVRHAEGDQSRLNWQTPSTILSSKGIKQAEVLATRLSNFKIIDSIITSDWARSQQTAKIVATLLRKPTIVTKNIHERQQSSRIYGLSRKSILSRQYWLDLTKNRNNWNYKWDNEEESMIELTRRSIDFKNMLIKNYSQKNVLVISHESFLSGLIATCLLGDKFNNNYFKNLFNAITMENTGLSLLIYNEKKNVWKMWYLNDYSHLQGL